MGPVAGGFIAETIGFKWIFIVIAIAAGVGALFGIPFLDESYAPVIQLNRAKKWAKDKEGDHPDHDVLLEKHQDPYHVLWVNLTSRSYFCAEASFASSSAYTWACESNFDLFILLHPLIASPQACMASTT